MWVTCGTHDIPMCFTRLKIGGWHGVPRRGVPWSTAVKPRYAVPKSLCPVLNRGSGFWFDGTPRYGPKYCGSYRGFEIVNLLTDCRLCIQYLFIFISGAWTLEHASANQSKSLLMIMNGYLLLFTIHLIYDINKIIYFSAQIWRDGNFYGTVWSTV